MTTLKLLPLAPLQPAVYSNAKLRPCTVAPGASGCFSAADIGGDPCASIAVYDDTIIAGFASGRVRCYSEKGEVLHDLQAHARCLTALTICGDRLATVAEDAHVFVWSLPSLEMVHASHVTDSLLTGAAFLDERSLACAAYDSQTVTVLRRGT